jgi:hypothetical protein
MTGDRRHEDHEAHQRSTNLNQGSPMPKSLRLVQGVSVFPQFNQNIR